MTKPKHSPVGPSALHRVLRCPASLNACSRLRPQESNEAARLGTAVHALIEDCLKNGELDATGYEGTNWAQDDGAPIVLTRKDVAGAQLCLDAVWPLLENADEYHVELKVEMPDIDPDLYGTTDIVVIKESPRCTHVIDYKNGFVHVDERDNEQLMAYALGVLRKFPHVGASEVVMTIIQPWSVQGGAPLRTVVYSVAELFDFALECSAGLALARSQNAPFVPGEKQCRWCSNRFSCGALFDAVQSGHAQYDFAAKELSDLTAEELGERYTLAKIAKIWTKAVDEAARTAASKGVAPAGYKPVSKPGHRRWRLPQDQVVSALVSRFKIAESELIETSLISPAELERHIGRSQMQMVRDLYESPDGWTLAPLSDKREALPASSLGSKAKQGFEPVED